MEIGKKGIQLGMIVRSRDGEKLGKVKSCDPETFLIEKGLFFPKDYLARYDQVGEIRDGEAWLLKNLGELDTKESLAGEGRQATGSEEVRVPLSEEQLEASKRVGTAGEVRVRKTVETEQQQISVPVMKEHVEVERVPAQAGSTPGEARFQDETISVPVREEEVEIRKRPVVREEVRVRKDRDVQEQRFAETVRKENVEIDEEGDLKKAPSDEPGGYKAPGTR
jgi:uncharacterized protein (TIGR02271 family)